MSRMDINDILFHVAASNGGRQRVVVASTGHNDQLHRGSFDTNSEVARERFFKGLSRKTAIPADDLLRLLDDQLVAAADEADAQADVEADQLMRDEEGHRPSQSTVLVELVSDAHLWHTPDGDANATIRVGEHRETWAIRSRSFKRWLARLYFVSAGGAPNSQAMQDALGVIEGKAVFEGPERAVHIRLAEHDGEIYLDLVDRDWRLVEVSAERWQVVKNSPVSFRRAKAMSQLPTPIRGGSLEVLRTFLNVTEEEWPLLVGWLLGALWPTGPYPVLCLHGEQGSAKSTTARVLRALSFSTAQALSFWTAVHSVRFQHQS